MTGSPYAGLDKRAFWRTGATEQHPFSITDLYRKRFKISPNMKIATAGSCFAQHIGRHLGASGYTVIDAEPAPKSLPPAIAQDFGYGIYSARYGNIYLAAQLFQILQEAFGQFTPANPVWEKEGRYFDAMRPSVEPDGLSSPEEVMAHRREHLLAVRRMIQTMDVFIFTFGLTEGWVHNESGTCYPTAPGTLAGTFDPEVYSFRNFTLAEIKSDFLKARKLIRSINPKCKFIITVSPVPLTATASGNHVISATMYSKSVLRAVAGELTSLYRDIDYFPSYELIASPFSRGMFYSPNLRNVESQGVETVMRVFFSQHPKRARKVAPSAVSSQAQLDDEVVCEEVLLEAFNK